MAAGSQRDEPFIPLKRVSGPTHAGEAWLIVVVPHGDAKAPIRPPVFDDETYGFLASCGILEPKYG